MAQIDLEGVYKNYGPVQAVKGISFSARDGEYVALLGPSGCGKSSTMRMIAGLEEITDGTIKIDGRVVNGLDSADRNVAMAFENYGLYPHMTVFSNIAYPLRIRGHSDEEIVREVVRTAGLLHIQNLLDRRPRDLSTGVQQRVSLARALVRKPTVFLLDEPLSHLDAELRGEMRDELKRLQAVNGGTMIHVTHDQLEALSLADRVVVMDDGLIQQIGTPAEIYSYPANRFVATFIGDPPMNMFEAMVGLGDMPDVQVEGVTLLRLDGPLTLRVQEACGRDGSVEIGVRPRDLELVSDGSGLRGSVRVRESHGEAAVLTIDTGRHRVRLEAAPNVAARDGDNISIRPRPDRVHFFERGSGRAVGGLAPDQNPTS